MEMKKASAELVTTFEKVAPGGPEAVPKKMFGYPCSFVRGNMFMGLMGDQFILRLRPEDKAALEAAGGTPVQGPQGSVMKEYLALPPTVLADAAALSDWVARGYAYAASLPAKEPKQRKTAPGKATRAAPPRTETS
jgi:TfoX/Sxy family transcriptional regulator of competence genes